jgi:hypothetical protein
VHAVAIADTGRLALQLEYLTPARPVRQLHGALVQLVPFTRGPALVLFQVEAIEQAAARLHACGIDRAEQILWTAEVGHRRVIGRRADEQRAVLGAEVPAGADVRGAEDRIADAADEPHVGRGVVPTAATRADAREDGAEVRRVRRRTRLAAQQVVHRVEMITDISHVRHRADHAEAPAAGGEARGQLADAHPGDGGGDRPIRAANALGRLGLGVPGIEMTRATAQQQKDARLVRRPVAQGSLTIDPCRHQPRRAECQRADAAGLEESASRNGGCAHGVSPAGR